MTALWLNASDVYSIKEWYAKLKDFGMKGEQFEVPGLRDFLTNKFPKNLKTLV